jgi:hypothetical protein
MVLGKNLLALKSGVKKIRPESRELSDVQENLGNTLQSVVGHLVDQANGYQQAIFAPVMQQLNPNVATLAVKTPALFIRGRPDGPFIPNQPSILFGSAAAKDSRNGTIPQQDICLFSYGQIVAFGSTSATDGFVIIPRVSGPAFRVAPNNTYTCFQINFDGTAGCTGAFNAGSFLSPTGFKAWLPPMMYWNTSYPGGNQLLQIPIGIGSASNTTPWYWCAPRSGSVTAISIVHTATSNVVCAIFLYKNGANIYSYNVTNNASSGAVAIPKGTLPFVFGDVLSAQIAYSTGNINVCTQVALEVEEVA